MGEGAPQNGCCQYLYPQGELQLPPASPGASPRSAGRSDPEFFQTTVSALGPTVREIVCAPFKSGVSISHSPLDHVKVSPSGLQSHTFWGLHFLLSYPSWGAQYGTQTPCSLGRTSAVVIMFSFVDHSPRGMGLECTITLPTPPAVLL